MMRIHDFTRRGTLIFLAVTAVVVAMFLYLSGRLVSDLSAQERERMQIWADATRQLANIGADGAGDAATCDVEFLLGIIERNHTIPVVLTDDSGTILSYRNFSLPEPVDSTGQESLSEANAQYLEARLEELRGRGNEIHITVTPLNIQHLYYEDSTVLKRLGYYPYVQLAVMLVFIAVVYFAVSSARRAEQNKIWVGLSKETAHQLGTPISSLMAWVELLPQCGVPDEYVREMDKDVKRLSTIASRFSKIGSVPTLETVRLYPVVKHAADYMSTRISDRISLTVDNQAGDVATRLSVPLFEWVTENLIKNAVDAMEGAGCVTVSIRREGQMARILVTDTGKGIPRKDFEAVFTPGF
ncbi:MAG: HAMP domain-containing histidine kinase, partial [Muribaculaceae bacterium]|nr:HAMP domain-containing histidine kinase [Muribaculaceae bacterium]